MINTQKRSCDGCTKCCDGWLSGEAHGKRFNPGLPCHFVGKNGCTIYKDRPENPCKIFVCQWLIDNNVPEWMKPELANVIIVAREKAGVKYWAIQEAGEKLRVEVLNWLITHCIHNSINLLYMIEGNKYRLGSAEFSALEM